MWKLSEIMELVSACPQDVIRPLWLPRQCTRCPRSFHKRAAVDLHINSVLWLVCYGEGGMLCGMQKASESTLLKFVFRYLQIQRYRQSFIRATSPLCQSALVWCLCVCVTNCCSSFCFVVTRHPLRISDPDGVLRFLGACHLWCQARGLDLAMLLLALSHHEQT